MNVSFFGDLLHSIADRGRSLLWGPRSAEARATAPQDPVLLFQALLSGRGEASGVALAREILDRWKALDGAGRRDFLTDLAEGFGPDRAKLEAAIQAYQQEPSGRSAALLHEAAEPRRQEVLRRLNLAPGGTKALVRMRETLFQHLGKDPELDALDRDFQHLFGSWFNRGFLVLRPIDWTTPANILDKIIRYEAVHAIRDWNDLRRRIEPADRRCFAFFHPQLGDEPLIFVEVALTAEVPGDIASLLAEDRPQIRAEEATTAVFYSISNCQEGLRGISFGNFLIKQVVEDLRRDLPKLSCFVTLSPVPGFASWLARERKAEASTFLAPGELEELKRLDERGWHQDPLTVEALRKPLLTAGARYLVKAKSASGKAVDPVARFHLGNGARLERLNYLGDLSERGLAQAHGLMVNYLYKLDDIERNHECYAARGEVAASDAVRRLIAADPPSKDLVPAGKSLARV